MGWTDHRSLLLLSLLLAVGGCTRPNPLYQEPGEGEGEGTEGEGEGTEGEGEGAEGEGEGAEGEGEGAEGEGEGAEGEGEGAEGEGEGGPECEPGDTLDCGTDIGECTTGWRSCTFEGRWSECFGALGPTPEVCDGLDNDCDGATDEDLAGPCDCLPGATRACGSNTGVCIAGMQWCVGGSWGSCIGSVGPSAERCNGLDDDCDGPVDEDWPELGTVCEAGLGVCRGQDVWRCDFLGTGTYCDGEDPFEATFEVCDGLDNDCDGVVDDGIECCLTGPVDPGAPPAERWVRVCAGTFVMGSPGVECGIGCQCGVSLNRCRDPRCAGGLCPGAEQGRTRDEVQHPVTLTRSLLVQATEVTRWQWQEIFPEEAPWRNDECGLDCPVEEITWYQAVAYCNERSLLEGLEPCYEDEESGEIYSASSAEWWVTPSWPLGLDCEGYRLPTEAEWEYFARAGSPGAYPTGGTQVDLAAGCETLDPPLDRVAWYCGNAGGLVHPVAEKEPNAWGLFDVLGNVGELCWDGFDPTAVFGHQPVTDPLGPRIASYQVQRGGSYLKLARTTRLARREGVEPDFISPDRGFRPVRTLTD